MADITRQSQPEGQETVWEAVRIFCAWGMNMCSGYLRVCTALLFILRTVGRQTSLGKDSDLPFLSSLG
jgi:hypothetical protein